uniref:Uncharacterized protein n=1 Tax=Oryza sativa subsp. japonica TaxID=39947 RepID=Q6YVL3_ORYSJ|nr:hypothetical protein [Oryza sativa Japonica Group]
MAELTEGTCEGAQGCRMYMRLRLQRSLDRVGFVFCVPSCDGDYLDVELHSGFYNYSFLESGSKSELFGGASDSERNCSS